MIIFYNKKSGQIVGTIDGRVHDESHLKMWIGDKKETGRIVCQWKPTGKKHEQVSYENKLVKIGTHQGEPVFKVRKVKQVNVTRDYEPDIQKDVFTHIDRGFNVYNYKVDLKTKHLILKQKMVK